MPCSCLTHPALTDRTQLWSISSKLGSIPWLRHYDKLFNLPVSLSLNGEETLISGVVCIKYW